jgi:hypothetical protein
MAARITQSGKEQVKAPAPKAEKPKYSQVNAQKARAKGLEEATKFSADPGDPISRAAARRNTSPIVPLKPQVSSAIQNAAEHLSKADLKGKKVEGILLGTYVQAGEAAVPKELNPKGLPVSVFVCMDGTSGVVKPGQKIDGNSAHHFYVKIGSDTYGPLEFNNPLFLK